MSSRFVLIAGLLMSLGAAGCGRGAPTADEGAAAPTTAGGAAVEAPTMAPVEVATVAPPADAPADAPAPLSGADFIAQAASLSGTTVTLGRCSLLTKPGSDGSYACRVVDDGGNDLKTPDGLPVDVFFDSGGLDQAAKDFLANSCPESFCTVQLTGLLSVSEGTFFLKMANVALAPAP